MKSACAALIACALLLSVLAGGCIHATSRFPYVAVPTVAPTPAPVQTTPVPGTCSLVPGPIQIPPQYEEVSVSVDRNTIQGDPVIWVTFNGGQGNGLVRTMNVTVIHPDCTTDHGAKDNPVMGDTVTVMGSLWTDRVIVGITMKSDEQYTVVDDDFPFTPKV